MGSAADFLSNPYAQAQEQAKFASNVEERERSIRAEVHAEMEARKESGAQNSTLSFLQGMGILEDIEVLHRLIMASKNFKEVYLYSNKLAALSKYVAITKMSVEVAKRQKDLDRDNDDGNDDDIDGIDISIKR